MIAARYRAIPVRLAVSLALTGIIAYLSLVPGYPEEDDPAMCRIAESGCRRFSMYEQASPRRCGIPTAKEVRLLLSPQQNCGPKINHE